MNSPENFAALLSPQEWRALREDIAFLRAWRRAEFITAYGTRIPIQASKENAVVDLRAITPTGAQVQPVVPSQAGHADQVLITDGTTLSFAGRNTHKTMLRRAASQSIPTGGTLTPVVWDEVVVNESGVWSSGATTRLTMPVAGFWLFSAWMRYDINATGIRYCYLRKNGTLLGFVDTRMATTGGNYSYLSFCAPLEVEAADYFELCAYQESGGALNLLTAGGSAAEISALRLRD